MALRMYERVLGVRSLDRCLGAGRWGGGEEGTVISRAVLRDGKARK